MEYITIFWFSYTSYFILIFLFLGGIWRSVAAVNSVMVSILSVIKALEETKKSKADSPSASTKI